MKIGVDQMGGGSPSFAVTLSRDRRMKRGGRLGGGSIERAPHIDRLHYWLKPEALCPLLHGEIGSWQQMQHAFDQILLELSLSQPPLRERPG